MMTTSFLVNGTARLWTLSMKNEYLSDPSSFEIELPFLLNDFKALPKQVQLLLSSAAGKKRFFTVYSSQ
jgi:hypothetical protein